METDRGNIGCDFVVSAAGPQTGHIAEMAGVWVPVAPGRVEILVTAPIEPMWDGFVFGNGLYGRQTRRGNLAYGGGNQEWIDVDLASPEKPNTPLIRNVGRRLAELMPAVQHVPVIRTWAGVVEQTPDHCPIIDIVDHPNNFLVCTLSGDGFGISPGTGKAVSELVLHGESTIPTAQMNLGQVRGCAAHVAGGPRLDSCRRPDVGRQDAHGSTGSPRTKRNCRRPDVEGSSSKWQRSITARL